MCVFSTSIVHAIYTTPSVPIHRARACVSLDRKFDHDNIRGYIAKYISLESLDVLMI
jgi:hypothetical protein